MLIFSFFTKKKNTCSSIQMVNNYTILMIKWSLKNYSPACLNLLKGNHIHLYINKHTNVFEKQSIDFWFKIMTMQSNLHAWHNHQEQKKKDEKILTHLRENYHITCCVNCIAGDLSLSNYNCNSRFQSLNEERSSFYYMNNNM